MSLIRACVFAFSLASVVSLCGVGSALARFGDEPTGVDDDYALQGEYLATLSDAGDQKIGIQVIALGDGLFRAVVYHGGLPGAGWDRSDRIEVESRREGDRVVFESDMGSGVLADGKIQLRDADGQLAGVAEKVERSSPTLGAEPPAGATVLFDGTSVEAWDGGRMTDDGLLMQGTTSKAKFGSFRMHIEFRLPYEPKARGQGRGNSGIYFQGRYETQMLDSFGLTGEQNECGGLYSIRKPDVNMCLPPLTWQTYDVDFTAARYDGDRVVAAPRITVRHNGVVIHDDVELPADRSTTAAPVGPGPAPGPIYLQDHGNPVRYRNIWIVERE